MSKTIRWGIMGAGIIAEHFVDAVRSVEDGEVRAVASKSADRAASFAERNGIPFTCTYDGLVEREDIDAVYVATTHNFHHANVSLALEHGKPVLVEKPFTVNAAQARDLVRLAEAKGLFLMEAMWIRFLPAHARLRGFLRSGGIGEVRQVTAAFGNFVLPMYEGRLDDPDLAGGVTLDMGTYPLSFLSDMLGEVPSAARSACRFSGTGVDEIADYLLRYPSGCLGQVCTSYRLKMDGTAVFYGTRGSVEYPDSFRGESYTVRIHDGTNDVLSTETVTTPHHENGFVYQIEEVQRCLRTGLTESPLMPLEESTALMEVMDGMRDEWGLRYSFE